MAIKARDQVKWIDSGTELELEADTGEAFLVKDIKVYGASGEYLSVSIDKTTVGYFRISTDKLGNHLHFPLEDDVKKTLLGYLWDKEIFKGYPVAEGQKIQLKVNTTMPLVMVYDIYEPGDISPDMENGSEASEYMLINYGRVSESGMLSDGDNELVYSVLPSEFPNFPFGHDVPSKTQIDIYGILATDVACTTGSGANKQKTEYIKLIKEREVLFDEDKRGIPMRGNISSSDVCNYGTHLSMVGNYSSTDRRLPYMFTVPLTFSAGEELSVVLHTKVAAGSANIGVVSGEIALIEKIKRVA